MPDEKQTRENQEQIRAESSILLQINRPTPTLPPPKPRIIPALFDFSPPSALVFFAFAFAIAMTRVMTILIPVVIMLMRSRVVDVDVECRTPVPLKHGTFPPDSDSATQSRRYSSRLFRPTVPDISAECSFEPSRIPHPSPSSSPPPSSSSGIDKTK